MLLAQALRRWVDVVQFNWIHICGPANIVCTFSWMCALPPKLSEKVCKRLRLGRLRALCVKTSDYFRISNSPALNLFRCQKRDRYVLWWSLSQEMCVKLLMTRYCDFFIKRCFSFLAFSIAHFKNIRRPICNWYRINCASLALSTTTKTCQTIGISLSRYQNVAQSMWDIFTGTWRFTANSSRQSEGY